MPITRSLPSACTVPLEKHLKNYYVVGGMPEDALEWLIDAGIVYKQKQVEKPELPLYCIFEIKRYMDPSQDL